MATATYTIKAEDQTQGAFNSIKRSLAGLEGSALSLRNVLAGLGAGISVAGLTALVKNSIDAADGLNKLSQKVGVSVESLSKLQYAAKLSDVSTQGLGDGLRKLSIALDDLQTGSKPAVEAFAKIGITAKQLQGLSPDQAFLKIADALKGLDVAARNNALSTIFGKSFAELVPLLNQGSAGLKAAGDEAQRFGRVISSDVAKASEEFNDNITRLKESFSGLSTIVAGSIVGTLARITTQFLDAARAAGTFGEAIARISVGQGKNLPDEIQQVEVAIERLRIARKKLSDLPAGSRDPTSLLNSQDLLDQENALRVQRDFLRQLLDIRRQRTAIENAPTKGNKPIKIDDGSAAKAAAAARKAAQAQAEREAEAASREIGRQTSAIAVENAAVAAAQLQAELAPAAKAAAELSAILSRTPSGQLAAIQKELLVLNEALADGKISAKQYAEGFKLIEEATNDVLGRTATPIQGISDSLKKQLADMQFAVEKWGRGFTDTLATAIETGKLDFRSLAQSIIGDLLRMTIQAQITAPLFKAFSSFSLFSASGNAFGMGGNVLPFARGGVVNSPTMFKFAGGTGLMGEAGPEAILPLKRGANGKLGVESSGGGSTIVVNIDSRSDRALIQSEVRRGVEQGLAAQADSRRRGGGG